MSRFGRQAVRAVVALPWLLLASACGGGKTSPGAAAAPDGGRIVASGFAPPASQCQTDSDCPSFAPVCAPLLRNGYRVCVERNLEATAPSSAPGTDECDQNRPCSSGHCYLGVKYPSGICGLGGGSPGNVCRTDECASDGDCGNGVCGPAGLSSDSDVSGGGVRECFVAACKSNADCTAKPGGVCAFVQGYCLRYAQFVRAQFACVYPDGCLQSADCCGGTCGTCQVVNGAAVCVQ